MYTGSLFCRQTALGMSPCYGGATTHVQRWLSLPARPHSTGRRVREEPITHVHRWSFLAARPHSTSRHIREELQHSSGGHPCWSDRTRQVAVSERSRNTRTQVVISAGQTALGRLLCQGGAATHVHRLSYLLARPHLTGCRVREEPQHMYTDGPTCRPDSTQQVAVSGRSRNTRTQGSYLPARPHSAGHRIRVEPQHTYTGSHP